MRAGISLRYCGMTGSGYPTWRGLRVFPEILAEIQKTHKSEIESLKEQIKDVPFQRYDPWIPTKDELSALLGQPKFPTRDYTEQDIVELLKSRTDLLKPEAEIEGVDIPVGGVGRADLLLRAPDERQIVVEVKRDNADHVSVGAVQKYMAALARESEVPSKIVGMIVAPGFGPSLIKALEGCRYPVRIKIFGGTGILRDAFRCQICGLLNFPEAQYCIGCGKYMPFVPKTDHEE